MSFYVIGGTLQTDAPSYVERQADHQLFEGLLQGDFCYVLTARQMGKSSLMVRTANRLRMAGVHVVALDLTALGGQNITAPQWYFGLLDTLGQELGLADELEAFWQDNEHLGPLHRFMKSIRQLVLPRLEQAGDKMRPQAGADGPTASALRAAPVTRTDDETAGSISTKVRLVIFVDEIDFVRILPFSTDEFFAAIRECYNRRTRDSTYEQVTFCLLGVASPSDLVRDTRTTPFNIGRRVELNDFTLAEAAALVHGLEDANRGYRHSKLVLDRIFYWTAGHPYLTQRLCRAAAEALRAIGKGATSAAESPSGLVDRLCTDLFFSSRARERDDNLIFVRERLLRNDADLASVLDLYLKIWQGKRVMDDEFDPVISLLGLSGVARVAHGRLNVRNRIYYRVFDAEWVRSNLPEAELRRQREAYRRGWIRATALTSVIVIAMGLMSLVMVKKTSEANLAQAKASRSSGRMGQRIDALRAIERAKRWSLGSGNLSEFQNESIAALNLVDLEGQSPDIEPSTENTTVPELNDKFTRYAVGKQDGRIAIVKRVGNVNQVQLPGIGLPVRWLRFSPDDRYLAAGYARESHGEARIIVWSLADRNQLISFSESSSRDAIDFTWNSARLAVGSGGRRFRIYDLVNEDVVFDSAPGLAQTTNHPVSCLRFDPAGKRVAECSDVSLKVNVWDISQKASIQYPHPGGVLGLDWSPDGHQLVTACQNGDVTLWDVSSSARRVLYRTAADLARADVCFNRSGTVVVAICADLSLRLWRPQSAQQILVSFNVQDSARVRFSNDDGCLSLATRQGHLRLFTVVGGRELVTFAGDHRTSAGFQSIGFDPTGRVLMGAGKVSGLWLWDTQDHRASCRINLVNAISVGFDLEPPALLASTRNGFFRVPWQTVSREGHLEIDLGTPHCLGLPSSLDRFALATNGMGAVIHADEAYDHIHVFHLAEPEENYVITAHRELDALAISPDGSWLAASASSGGTNLVWNLQGQNLRSPLREFPGSKYLAFSPSGRWLLTSCSGKFQFRKTGGWQVVEELSIPRSFNFEKFAPVTFGRLASADECLLAVAISPTAIMLYRFLDRESPKLTVVAQLESPDRLPILSLAFNSGCGRLAAASEGQIVQVWDLARIREELLRSGLASNFPDFGPVSSDNRKLAFMISEANAAERETGHSKAEDWTRIEQLTQEIEAAEKRGVSDLFTALIQRGRVYLELKRYKLAQLDFEKSWRLRPDDETAIRSRERVQRLLESQHGPPASTQKPSAPNTQTEL